MKRSTTRRGLGLLGSVSRPPRRAEIQRAKLMLGAAIAAATAAYRVLSTLVPAQQPALDAICRAEARSLRLGIPMARTFLDPYLDLPTRRTAG